MKNLTAVVERAVADAIYAGAEWQAIAGGTDSADVGRLAKAWQRDSQYQLAVQHCQQRAVRDIADAIMRLRLTVETAKQQGLFGEEGAE